MCSGPFPSSVITVTPGHIWVEERGICSARDQITVMHKASTISTELSLQPRLYLFLSSTIYILCIRTLLSFINVSHMRDQSSSTVGNMFVLHMANPGFNYVT